MMKERSTALQSRSNLGIPMLPALNQARSLITVSLPLLLLGQCHLPLSRISPTRPLKHTPLIHPNTPVPAPKLVVPPFTRNPIRDMALFLPLSLMALLILVPSSNTQSEIPTNTPLMRPLTTPAVGTATPRQPTNNNLPPPTRCWKDSTVECTLLRRGTRRPPLARA